MREYKLSLFTLTRAIKAEKSKTNGHETRAVCVCVYVAKIYSLGISVYTLNCKKLVRKYILLTTVKYRVTQKKENFWKTQQKLKKSKKKKLLAEIESLQLAF